MGVLLQRIGLLEQGSGGGGGGGGDVVGNALPAGDAHWANVVLLTTFSGPDASTIFMDESISGHTLAPQGGLSILSDEADFAANKFIQGFDSADWLLSGDFTVELFGVKFDAPSGREELISQWNATTGQRSWSLEWRGDATPDDLSFLWSTNGSTVSFLPTDSFTPTAGQAYNFCVERAGSTLRIYIDSVMRAKGTLSGSLHNSTEPIKIGRGGGNGTSGGAQDLDGKIGAVRITKGVARYASDSGYTVPTLPLPKAPTADAMLLSYDAGARVEAFIDLTNIAASSGVSFGVMPLTKYASNPVLNGSATWDRDKLYVNALLDGGTYKTWYANLKESPWDYEGSSYATSADGISWTKPNLGLVTYNGNTNNNIFDAKYDPTVIKDGSTYYILFGADASGNSNNQALIYSSANGYSGLTLQKTITHGSYAEFHGFARRADGRWLAYYTRNQGGNLRTIGAYLSDTTDITGAWTDQGDILTPAITGNQYYSLSATLIDGVLYGLVHRYNGSAGAAENIWLDLFTSTDGVTWTSRKPKWLRNGPDSYDVGMIFGKSLIDDGSEIRYYYGGSVSNHAATPPRDARLCYAALDSGRLGTVYGAGGTVTTTALTPSSGLFINAVSSGGRLKAELLDPADDSVRPGFSKADCDNLDGNWARKEVTWGGVPMPTGGASKIKFYLDA